MSVFGPGSCGSGRCARAGEAQSAPPEPRRARPCAPSEPPTWQIWLPTHSKLFLPQPEARSPQLSPFQANCELLGEGQALTPVLELPLENWPRGQSARRQRHGTETAERREVKPPSSSRAHTWT